MTKLAEGSGGRPLAELLFTDSSPVAMPRDEYAAPVEIEAASSRFRLEPPRPVETVAGGTVRETGEVTAITRPRGVYPALRDRRGRRVMRAMLWLTVLGGIGAGAFVLFENELRALIDGLVS